MQYPDAFVDLATGELISHAHVAGIGYTAFTSTDRPVTAGLIVRRVLDANTQDPLFPIWRYHPFLTITDPNERGAVAADLAHRQHAICETTWSDLEDRHNRPSIGTVARAVAVIYAGRRSRPASGFVSPRL